MPYIPQNRRKEVRASILKCKNLGELCYHVNEDILDYLSIKVARSYIINPREGRVNYKWADYAEILGMLESIKLELYRRLIADHEDCAIEQNGDVFDV